MANWNEFVAGAKKTFNKAAVKVGEVADSAAESIKIEGLKIKLAEKYEELGRIVYEEVRSSKTNAERVGEKAAEIDALIAQIEALKEKKKNGKKTSDATAE
jgi:hypothetical protein